MVDVRVVCRYLCVVFEVIAVYIWFTCNFFSKAIVHFLSLLLLVFIFIHGYKRDGNSWFCTDV